MNAGQQAYSGSKQGQCHDVTVLIHKYTQEYQILQRRGDLARQPGLDGAHLTNLATNQQDEKNKQHSKITQRQQQPL